MSTDEAEPEGDGGKWKGEETGKQKGGDGPNLRPRKTQDTTVGVIETERERKTDREGKKGRRKTKETEKREGRRERGKKRVRGRKKGGRKREGGKETEKEGETERERERDSSTMDYPTITTMSFTFRLRTPSAVLDTLTRASSVFIDYKCVVIIRKPLE